MKASRTAMLIGTVTLAVLLLGSGLPARADNVGARRSHGEPSLRVDPRYRHFDRQRFDGHRRFEHHRFGEHRGFERFDHRRFGRHVPRRDFGHGAPYFGAPSHIPFHDGRRFGHGGGLWLYFNLHD